MGRFGVLTAVLGAAVTLFGAKSDAATLVYEATFTSTLSNWSLFLDESYDQATYENVDFNARRFSLAELGFNIGGLERGESRSGRLALYFHPDELDLDNQYSLDCYLTGTERDFCQWGNYLEASLDEASRSFRYRRTDGCCYVYEAEMDPLTGSYRYMNDAYYQGTTGGVFWSAFGIEYEFQFTDIRITTPAPVPLPAGGLLLASAFGVVALMRRRQLAQASAVR
ncbi:MAG: putative extracellular protein [Rhodobacteraceae bacterium HLUCCA08]|nr:MAG: putative extracellular protein [Rhodobacteraceae bacterium HLUCCA08]